MSSERDEVWGEFQRTSVQIAVPGGLLCISPAALTERGRYLPGQAGPLHVVTAWNPQGLEAPIERNREANVRLAAELDGMGVTTWQTTGVGEGGSWTEEGFTVAGLSDAEALALARRYDQRAVFTWRDEPGGFRLVACDASLDEPRGWTATLRPPPTLQPPSTSPR